MSKLYVKSPTAKVAIWHIVGENGKPRCGCIKTKVPDDWKMTDNVLTIHAEKGTICYTCSKRGVLIEQRQAIKEAKAKTQTDEPPASVFKYPSIDSKGRVTYRDTRIQHREYK